MAEWKWETVKSIRATNGEAVFFRFPVELLVMEDEIAFCILVLPAGIGTSHGVITVGSAGRTLDESLDALVARIRRRVTRYLTTYADLLTDVEIEQKVALLACVDIVESGLMVGVRPTGWVFGCVEKTETGLVFRTNDDPPRDLDMEQSIAVEEQEIGRDRLAEAINNKGGYPVGPVFKLEPVLANDAGAVWEEWRIKIAELVELDGEDANASR